MSGIFGGSLGGCGPWVRFPVCLALSFLFLLAAPLPANAAIAYKQANTGTNSTAASVVGTYASAQTAGDTNIVVVGWNDVTATIKSVTDSLGNSYTLAAGPTTLSSGSLKLTQAIYYAANIKAGSNKVTVTFSQTAVFVDVRILEYSGLAASNPVDKSASASGTGANGADVTTAALNTSNANDLIFGAGTTTWSLTPGLGYTSRITDAAGNIAEDKIVASTGGYAAWATLVASGTQGWVMQTVAFEAAPVVPPYALTVADAGTGAGTVTSSTGGIDCGSACTASITSGASVTLTATASSGSSFTGWSGGCSGTGSCTVSAAATVTATFAAAPPAAPLAFKQAGDTFSTAASVAAKYTSAQTAGDTNIVVVGWNDVTSTIKGISDQLGNSYTLAAGPTTLSSGSSNLTQAIYYAANIKAGTNTVTVAFSKTATEVDLRVLEYSGLAASNPMDKSASALGTGTNGADVTTSAPATSNANDLIFGAGTTTWALTPGSGYTSRITAGGQQYDGAGNIAEDKIVTATGEYAAWGTLVASGTQGWVMQTVAFSTAPGSTTTTTTTPPPTTTTSAPPPSSSTCLSDGPYSITNQQSTSCEFYAGSLFTKPLPSDVGSHLAANSDSIIMSIFGNSPTNAEDGVIAQAASGGAMKEAFYYANENNPIYYFASVSGPPSGANAHNPQGIYAHFPSGAYESGASGPSDHEMAIWDQSTDIDSTPGGRIFAFYDYGVGSVRQLPACTCTTEACAAQSCVIDAYVAEYSYPGQDNGAYFAGNGYASAGYAPGAGLLRSQEIMSGAVNHAVMLEYSCAADVSAGDTSSGQYVFPANQSVLPCGQQGTPATTVGLANGNLLWIDSGYDCGQLPAYQQGVCKAMQTYGGYTHDTGGQNPEGVTIMLEEQGTAYAEAGITDPLYSYLKGFTTGACSNSSGWSCSTNGLEVENSLLQADIPWFNMPGLITATSTHLHIIDPCVAIGMAGLSSYGGEASCQ